MSNANNELCTKEPIYAKFDEMPGLEANKMNAVVLDAGHRFMQSPPETTKVMPTKPKSIDRRPRKHLTENEVERLKLAAKKIGRYGERDALIILLMYRHGLRVSELCDLKWASISWDTAEIYITRKKKGSDSTHFLEGDELRLLRAHKRNQKQPSPFIFVSERRLPLSSRAVQNLIERAGVVAGIEFPVNSHALRHSAGFRLANSNMNVRRIQNWLGHKQISHTVTYTQLASGQFADFGKILGG